MTAITTDVAQAATVRLTLRFPFWTEIFFSMTVREATAEDGIDTAATDGRTLWINREFFSALSLDEQVGVLAHELSHKIFLHPSRQGHREAQLWNIACDLAINQILVDNGFRLPASALLDAKYKGWSAEAIYSDLLQNRKDGKGEPPQMPAGWADLRVPTGTPEQIARHEEEVKALVERAVANAKAMGNVPAGIEAGIVSTYKAAREPWYNHLHRYMQALANSEYNWAKLNRRALKTHGVFAPLHQSEALGTVALFIDTSGSCFSKAEQANFASHLNAILAETKPQKVMVYYFDTKVYPGEEIDAGTLDMTTKPVGGGGTDFSPLFTHLEENDVFPDVAIVLTDMEGRFPSSEPEFPVVWADVYGGHDAPFGEVIHVE